MPGTSFPGVISGISGIRTALSCAQPLLKDEPQSGLDCPGISMPRRISVKTGQQQVPLSTAGRASGQGTGNGPKTGKDPACQANPAAPEPATLRFSPSSRTSGWTGSPGPANNPFSFICSRSFYSVAGQKEAASDHADSFERTLAVLVNHGPTIREESHAKIHDCAGRACDSDAVRRAR